MKIEDLNSNAAAPKEFVNTIVFGLVTSIPLEVIRTMWYHMAILSLGQKVITSTAKSKFNNQNSPQKILLSSWAII
jgi:hypothetical protein